MLAHDIAAALPQLRAEAEARMVDACRLAHPATEPTFDPDTGEWDPGTTTVYYEGPCEVQSSDSLTVRTVEAGEEVVTVHRVTLKVPVAVTGVEIGDTAEITASVFDPDLVGAAFRVTSGHEKSYATARRLRVERNDR